MPLPLLLIPLAIAGGSALAQVVAKLKAHSRLSELKAQLEQLESEHQEGMQRHYDRQVDLCRQLGLPEPELPPALMEPEPVDAAGKPVPKWRRLVKRQSRTLADGPAQSRTNIIGRHGASFAAGTVWKTSSTTIINMVSPLYARLLSFLPRIALVGGGGVASAGGSVLATTTIRFALSAVSVVGIVLGPVLAAWSIIKEVRKVRKARWELEAVRLRLETELTDYADQTRELQSQIADRQPGATLEKDQATASSIR